MVFPNCNNILFLYRNVDNIGDCSPVLKIKKQRPHFSLYDQIIINHSEKSGPCYIYFHCLYQTFKYFFQFMICTQQNHPIASHPLMLL